MKRPHCWGKMTWILKYKLGQEPFNSICNCEHHASECMKLTRELNKMTNAQVEDQIENDEIEDSLWDFDDTI